MKYVAPVRRELGIRTIFNVLGPLTNPAHATRMVLGVFNADYVDKIAAALNQLGVTDAWWSLARTDWTRSPPAARPRWRSCATQGGALHRKAGGLWPDPLHQGRPGSGTALENAEITKNILLGKSTPAQRTAAVLNAGAAIYVAIDG